MKTTEGLFFAVKEMRMTRSQSIDEGIVVSASRLINSVRTTRCGEETDKIKLLRCKRLLADDEDAACNERARLFGHTADERANLIAFFRRHHIEHRLPGGVANAREPEHLHETKCNNEGKNRHKDKPAKAPILSYMKPPHQGEVEVSSVKVGKLSEMKKDSSSIVRFGSKPVLLIRLADGEFRAFSGTCTHLDCTVQYRHDMGTIWCACHNGKYDLTGRNVSGPPPRPLDPFRVVIQGEDVYISKQA